METDIPMQYREDFFRTVADTVSDPVTLVGKDFRILYHNKRVSNLYGSIVGKVCFEAFFGLRQPCENCFMRDVLKDGKPRKRIEKLKLPDGRTVWVEINAAPFKNADEETIGVIDILRDITEQKEARALAEEAFARLNAELAEIESERKQVEKELRKSERKQSLMNRIAEIFVSVPDDQMYGDVLQVVLEAMESPHGTFAYINEHGDRVVPSMSRDIWDTCKISGKDIVFPRERWGGIWGRCLIARKSIHSEGPFTVPEGHIPIKRALAVPIIHKAEVTGNFMVGNKKTEYGEADVELLEAIASRVAPILHARLNRERDEKERIWAEESLQTSYRFLEIANRYTEMTPLLNRFILEIKKLTGCEAAGIRVLDGNGNIPYQAYDGFSEEFYSLESPLSIKSDRCMCVNVIKGKPDPSLPFYTAGGSFFMNGTTRFLATVSEDQKGKTRNVCNRLGYESVALVPIRSGDHIIGLIHFADPREDAIPQDLVKVMEWAAMELGTAIRRVQAREELQRAHDELEQRVEKRTAEIVRASEKLKRSEEELRLLSSHLLTAQEAERRRIAGDLHDSICQSLNMIKLKIGESLGHLDNGMVGLAGEMFKKMTAAIQDILDEVREICMGLRPSSLDDLGIMVTIDWFCREFQELHPEIGIEKELSVEERQVPESLKIVIYRLLQEALNNVAKHSKADRVRVALMRKDKDNMLDLTIEDNGRGFDLEEVLSVESTQRGLGLGTMRERTGLSGGSFSIETAKDAGTVVKASWPAEE
jgi:PAS domain S-box-containing protein